MELILNLVSAWQSKAKRTAEILQHAEAAPALFRPAYVAELVADLEHQMAWTRYWAGQVSR